MKKNLNILLDLRDQAVKLYDEMRFHNNINYNSFKLIKKQRDILTNLILESAEEYMPVITTEECIIEPGEEKELQTNIDNLEISSIEENKILEFTHKGIICTSGYLTFYLKKDYENGNKIMVKNNVPEEVNINPNEMYHYCDPIVTEYFWRGIYKIEKNQMIGLIGYDNDLLETTSLDMQENVNQKIKKIQKQNLMQQHIKDI